MTGDQLFFMQQNDPEYREIFLSLQYFLGNT